MLFRCHSPILSRSPLPTSHCTTNFRLSDSGYSYCTLPSWRPFGFHYAANQSRAVWFRWRCLLKDISIKPYHCSDTNIWKDKKPEPICMGAPQLPHSTPCMAPATAIWSCDRCAGGPAGRRHGTDVSDETCRVSAKSDNKQQQQLPGTQGRRECSGVSAGYLLSKQACDWKETQCKTAFQEAPGQQVRASRATVSIRTRYDSD